jgi:hypothetical protein
MLKPRAGVIIGNALPRIPVRGGSVDVEALSPEDAARVAGLSRSFLYQALNYDPAKRKGLPHLKSFKVGKARRIRLCTLRQWLADLERAQQPPAVDMADPPSSSDQKGRRGGLDAKDVGHDR